MFIYELRSVTPESLRTQGIGLLRQEGSRVRAFEEYRSGSVWRLIKAGLNCREAGKVNIPPLDFVDHINLALPIQVSRGRFELAELRSEFANFDRLGSLWVGRKGWETLELTERGGAVIWTYEAQTWRPPVRYSLYGQVPTRTETFHRPVQKEVDDSDLSPWKAILDGLAKEAFKVG